MADKSLFKNNDKIINIITNFKENLENLVKYDKYII